MSINHFSTDIPGPLLWTHRPTIMDDHRRHHHSSNHPDHPHNQTWLNLNPDNLIHHPSASLFHSPNTSFPFNVNDNDDDVDDPDDQTTSVDVHTIRHNYIQREEVELLAKEPMFEKPLTPSDVGKLNRLVIPKQHAEKYFPLGGGGESGEKGLLLSFEDELGKCWRFRYSYWNSSQSYVLTKGWSRYVKEKRLDSGDVVFFERHLTDEDRLFIGCRRRLGSGAAHDSTAAAGMAVVQNNNNGNSNSGAGGEGWTRIFYSAHNPYPAPPAHHHRREHQNHAPYQPADCLHPGYPVQGQTMGVGHSKILRLFGVNMECQADDHEPEPSAPAGSYLWRQGPFYPDQSPNHMDMDITFCGDVKQIRNRRG